MRNLSASLTKTSIRKKYNFCGFEEDKNNAIASSRGNFRLMQTVNHFLIIFLLSEIFANRARNDEVAYESFSLKNLQPPWLIQ